eukprot:5414612-Amphidinium_carterae.1
MCFFGWLEIWVLQTECALAAPGEERSYQTMRSPSALLEGALRKKCAKTWSWALAIQYQQQHLHKIKYIFRN